MKIKLPSWFKRNPRTVLLTGEDIINLRQDVDHLDGVMNKILEDSMVTLREDVNSALSAAAKAIYQLEELEIRITTAEAHIVNLEE